MISELRACVCGLATVIDGVVFCTDADSPDIEPWFLISIHNINIESTRIPRDVMTRDGVTYIDPFNYDQDSYNHAIIQRFTLEERHAVREAIDVYVNLLVKL